LGIGEQISDQVEKRIRY